MENTKIKIIRKENSLIPGKEILIVEALGYQEVCLDSFLGKRIWWIEKGSRLRIKVKKSEMIEIGDTISFEYCVRKDWAGWNPTISWRWKYY